MYAYVCFLWKELMVKVLLTRPPMALFESDLNSEQASLKTSSLYLHWKMYFGTETNGLNSESVLIFEWSWYQNFIVIKMA